MNRRMAKRSRTDHLTVDIWKRELGQLPNRSFSHRFAASEDVVRRFEVYKKLERHRGCVNTVSFNTDGDILVSGSDDRQVILWDWESGSIKLSFRSGHRNNVFQAKVMPFSDDRCIVTSAADGQVRHAKILESGGVETCLLGKHQGQVHKLAVEPGSPFIFYTCGEDGLVKHFDLRTRVATNLFTCKDTKYKLVVYLNAIAIDPRNPTLFAVGGMDEYARVYDIRNYKSEGWYNFGEPVDYFCPHHLIGDDQVGITGLAFSDQSELLASYNDEFIYLFTRDMGLGPNPSSLSSSSMESAGRQSDADDKKALPQVYKGHKNRETVKGVNFFGPKCEFVISGSDCGRIFIWRKKDGELIRVMKADKQVVNCTESHPHMPVLCSSGIEHDIKIWIPKATEKATLPENIEQVSLPGNNRGFSFLGFDDDDDDDEEEDDDDTGDEDNDEYSDENNDDGDDDTDDSYGDDYEDGDDDDDDDEEEDDVAVCVDYNEVEVEVEFEVDDDDDVRNVGACSHHGEDEDGLNDESRLCHGNTNSDDDDVGDGDDG